MAATATATTGIAGLGADNRTLIRLTQALQDAIVFRRARVGAYCHDCAQAAEGRCDDHHCDLELIAAYERDVQAIATALRH